ncbi:MAG: SGNH/GDSL hydrolase family protein [Chitinophagaceae bacterium]|nr:SGNH/GDSL hydrolase family protein [Chitinophagaceae bacterium]
MIRIISTLFLLSCFAFTSMAQKSSTVAPTKGVCIGNSTVAKYHGGESVATLLFTDEEVEAGFSCSSLAVPGHSINQQLEAWKNFKDKGDVDWIIVQIGLNDLDPSDPLDNTLNRYQKLIDTINLMKKSNAKVIIAAMIPCRQRLLNIYKKGKVSFAKWRLVNNAIIGRGKKIITGVDHRIDGYIPVLGDSNSNLKAEFQTMNGDHIHENTAGRMVIAGFWRLALAKLKFL